ncbi:MAG: HIT domain-containing protein [Actinomycetota bacterium]
MKQLWAPWRVKYIMGEKPKGCIFCHKPKEKKDKENYIVYRGESCCVMMNLYPYNSGHLMISPYKHVPDLEGLSDEELLELMEVLRRSMRVLRSALKPEGFNIGMNVGEVAGAGFGDHVHIHVVPRWAQDTNFMPVISDTKVISEALDATYERLVGEEWS